jgi:hypothetical protein
MTSSSIQRVLGKWLWPRIPFRCREDCLSRNDSWRYRFGEDALGAIRLEIADRDDIDASPQNGLGLRAHAAEREETGAWHEVD